MSREYLIKPKMDFSYPIATHGQGIYIYDEKGNSYIDGSSGAVTASIGHGVTEIIEAMNEQAQLISFTYRSQFANHPSEALARKLSDLAPDDLNWSFFVNSGSEATETAMKIAIQHWQEKGLSQKNRILSRWTSYHGITMGALSMSGHVLRRKRFVSLLADYPTISAPDCYRCSHGECGPNCGNLFAQELETAIERIGAEHIAAFIAEPIIGASAGALTPPDGYFQKIREICDRHQVLFIADEVMTGIGRTGKMFAMEHWNVTPDLIALGKGMSAGYTPIAATIVSDRVIKPILEGSKSVMAGHTYSANPQSSAVALKVIEYIEKNNLVKATEEKGAYLMQQMQALAKKYSIIGNVRGKGLLLGMEFVADQQSKQPFPVEMNITNCIVDRAFAKGLLIYPAAGALNGAGDAVIVAPPIIISREQIDELIALLSEALAEIESEVFAK